MSALLMLNDFFVLVLENACLKLIKSFQKFAIAEKFINMDNMSKWNKFIKSGTYNRSLKKYSDLSLLELNVNKCPTEAVSNAKANTVKIDPSVSSPEFWKNTNDVHDSFEVQGDEVSELVSDEEKSVAFEDYYSPDEDLNDKNVILNSVESDLTSFLQKWSLEHKISHAALKPLLTRLSQYDRTLPEDPRRLLDTPRKSAYVIDIEGGQYWHQGLGKSEYM